MTEWEYLIINQRIEPRREEPIPYETWELDHRGKLGWELVCTLGDDRLVFKRPKSTKPIATTGIVSVQPQGENMPLTIDSSGQFLQFQFADRLNEPTTAPAGDGSGVTVNLTSDNPAVAAVGETQPTTADANGNPVWQAPLTFGADGSFNAGAVVANTSGAPLVDDDGTTAFVQPATVSIPVAAGQAVTGDVTQG